MSNRIFQSRIPDSIQFKPGRYEPQEFEIMATHPSLGRNALISPRIYKSDMSHGKTQEMIVGLRGVQFDPDVVDAYLALSSDFEEIACRHTDSALDIHAKKNSLKSVSCTPC